MKFVEKIILKKTIKEPVRLKKKVQQKVHKSQIKQSRLKLPKNWIHG